MPPPVTFAKSDGAAIQRGGLSHLGNIASLGSNGVPADGASVETSAFRLYFNTIRIFWEMHCDEVKSLWSQKVVDVDVATAISQQLEKRTKELHHKLRPLIEEAFKQYDSNSDGVLDRDETDAFLADYGVSQVSTCEYIVEYGAELALMRQSLGRDIDQEHLQNVRSSMVAALREQHDAYLERARDHHRRVTRLLEKDKGAECQIGRETVVEALLPGTKRNKKFVQRLPTLLAHGFLPAWSALELRPQGKTLAAMASNLV